MFTFNDKQEVKEFIEKKNLIEEYWYRDMTEDDLDAFMEHISSTNKTFKSVEDFVETIGFVITSNKMSDMSQEDLEDLLDATKDKSDDEDNELSAENVARMAAYASPEDMKNTMQKMDDTELEKLIEMFQNDTEISSGVGYIKQGFIEYAREIIVNRAIPSLYDGLKPVQRRSLQILHDYSSRNYVKSAKVASDTSGELHPHGEDAVYAADALLTDANGSLLFPLIEGNGNFGNVNSNEPPAAKRYTEMRLHKNADEFFREMHGVDYIPSFDNKKTEAVELPVSFPNILLNASSGIAVGWKTDIPSFNFNEVCDLVLEYLKNGKCTTVIAPDFATGGIYIKNNKELLKLMETGYASLKIRAKISNDKKTVIVHEIPYNQTIQKITSKINDLNYNYIKGEAYDTQDLKSKTLLKFEITATTHLDEVLYYLYKRTPLQSNYNASIAVIDNGVPKNMGVWTIIELWVKHRREVLIKEYNWQINNLQNTLREAQVFLYVVNDKTRCYQLINTIVTSGKKAGMDYIANNFTREEVPEDLIEFVATRSLPSYHDGGSYVTSYQNALQDVGEYQKKIQDVDNIIVNQIKELKKTYGKKMPRRTEITDIDYNFKSQEIVKKSVDQSSCYYELKNNFLKKTRSVNNVSDKAISAKANSILVFADSDGRLIKMYGEDIPYTPNGEMGTYIPKYANIKETSGYKTKFICVADGSDYTIIFEDGYCSYLQTKDILEATRKTKVVSHGFNKDSFDKKTKIIPNILDILLLADSNNYMIYLDMTQFKYKSSASRTKLCNLARKTPFTKIYNTSNVDCIANKETYQGGRPKPIETNDFTNCSFQDFQEF